MSHTSHRIGPVRSIATITEYLDFECPYCAEAEGPIRRVMDAFEGEVSLVVRHFPLTDVHERAMEAALASEAAGLQGKFWEMHDLLFQYQEDLSMDTIRVLAQRLELNLEQFDRDRESAGCRSRVDQDMNRAESEGVDGTPTVFVNGKKLIGGVTFEALSRMVSGEIVSRAA
jgi:protein-disulfide isomerase